MVGLVIFLIAVAMLLMAKALDRAPPPIFGVYRRPGGLYWPKALLMFVLLSLKQVFQRLRPLRPAYYEALDHAQQLPPTRKAVDAVCFNATNQQGDCLFVGTARRPHRLTDAFLYLKLGGLGLLGLPQLPDTAHFNSGDELSFEAAGIHIQCLEPMAKWRLRFEGQLRQLGPEGRLYDVSIDALYRSEKPWFNYAVHQHPWSMAKALALEKWSRSYFNNVKRAHPLHFEQFGEMEAQVKVGGAKYRVRLDALRARNGDWRSLRHAKHWLTASNGDHFVIGAICQPVSYSRLQIGYVYQARERRTHPITACDLQLHQYGELGAPPLDYAFTFRAGGQAYAVQVNVVEAPHFHVSKRTVFACQCRAWVNGREAWGGAEWQYRNKIFDNN